MPVTIKKHNMKQTVILLFAFSACLCTIAQVNPPKKPIPKKYEPVILKENLFNEFRVNVKVTFNMTYKYDTSYEGTTIHEQRNATTNITITSPKIYGKIKGGDGLTDYLVYYDTLDKGKRRDAPFVANGSVKYKKNYKKTEPPVDGKERVVSEDIDVQSVALSEEVSCNLDFIDVDKNGNGNGNFGCSFIPTKASGEGRYRNYDERYTHSQLCASTGIKEDECLLGLLIGKDLWGGPVVALHNEKYYEKDMEGLSPTVKAQLRQANEGVRKYEEAMADMGQMIAGNATFKRYARNIVVKASKAITRKVGNAITTITWTVDASFEDNPIEFEAYFVRVDKDEKGNPKNLKDWEPLGPANKADATTGKKAKGNDLTYRVEVRNKKDGKPVPVPFDVKFTLTSSCYPGVCTNYPVKSNDKSNDLKFDKDNYENHPFAKLTGSGQNGEPMVLESTDANGLQTQAIISSYDFGANGTLKATVYIRNEETGGNGITVRVDDKEKEDHIDFPYDKNHNKIADKWEEEKGIYARNLQPDWDKEESDGNTNNGDGLTLFEEYRGFFCKGEHKRTDDPTKKNLFLYTKSESQAVLAARSTFEEAAHILISRLNDDELDMSGSENSPGYRQVNTNQTEWFGGAQHALYITKEAVQPNAPAGQSVLAEAVPIIQMPRFATRDEKDKILSGLTSPKDFKRIEVFDEAPGDIVAKANTIVHEMGHCVGMQHHGNKPDEKIYIKGDFWKQSQWLYSNYNPIASQYVQEDVAEVREHQIYIHAGVPQNSASGDVTCFMAYNNVYRFSAHNIQPIPEQPAFNKATLVNTPLDEPYSSFCTSPAGTMWNANGKHFGDADAGRGACLKRMKIKDW